MLELEYKSKIIKKTISD